MIFNLSCSEIELMLILFQGWQRIYDEEIQAESIASRIRPRSSATGVGPRGVETLAAVTEEYRPPESSISQKFPDYPQDFGPRITSIIKDSVTLHDDPAVFSVWLVSFVIGFRLLSDEFLDSEIAEVIKLECSNAYAAACPARKPSNGSIFLNTFDSFSSFAAVLAPVLSTNGSAISQTSQKVHFFELILFKCAVSFLENLMSRMKKEDVTHELIAIFKYLFPLCANSELSDDVKIFKLKPAIKILRTCFSKLGGGQRSHEIELSCECLLSALISYVLENSTSGVRTYDFKCKLLSHAIEWMTIARNCTLDFFKEDADFQPKIFESTHPYADNRMSPPPSLSLHIEIIFELVVSLTFFAVDTVIPITFLDAVELRIVFDKRCRTEAGCDYIQFFQGGVMIGPKCHGRSSSSSNVWPGVGAVPPLIVKGSFVEARFHSDGSNNDWGYYFTGSSSVFQALLSQSYHSNYFSFPCSDSNRTISFLSLQSTRRCHIYNFVAARASLFIQY